MRCSSRTIVIFSSELKPDEVKPTNVENTRTTENKKCLNHVEEESSRIPLGASNPMEPNDGMVSNASNTRPELSELKICRDANKIGAAVDKNMQRKLRNNYQHFSTSQLQLTDYFTD
jgi:hypothetical protein